VACKELSALDIEIAEQRDRLRTVGLVAIVVEIFDDAVDRGLRDAKASLQMRRNTTISLSETEPSARIMRNSIKSSADSTGSSATLRTPASPSKIERIWSSSAIAIGLSLRFQLGLLEQFQEKCEAIFRPELRKPRIERFGVSLNGEPI